VAVNSGPGAAPPLPIRIALPKRRSVVEGTISTTYVPCRKTVFIAPGAVEAG